MPDYVGSICNVCGRKIEAGAVFIVRHALILGHEAWLPMHCMCALKVKRGQAKIRADRARMIDDYVAVPDQPEAEDEAEGSDGLRMA